MIVVSSVGGKTDFCLITSKDGHDITPGNGHESCQTETAVCKAMDQLFEELYLLPKKCKQTQV